MDITIQIKIRPPKESSKKKQNTEDLPPEEFMFYIQKGIVGLTSDTENMSLGKEDFIKGMKAQGQIAADDDSILNESESKRQKEHLFISSNCGLFDEGMNGFSMNNKNVFFWNDRKIWYFDIDTKKCEFNTF